MKLCNIKPFLILICIGFLFSCDFAEKNISPNTSSTIEPGPLLTYVQLYTTDNSLCKRTQVGYCMMMVQQTASLEREEMAGDKYLETATLGEFFTSSYTSVIKNTLELINRTKEDEKLSNTYAVALIWKSFLFHRMTDLYGDIPYSEAGNGYALQNFYPKYDKQSDVYAGMIADIEKGLSLLSESKPAIVNGDIVYHGDITRWKRFGNSLLLRLGMRLEKADPALSKATVLKALQGGVMQEADDICMVQHVAGKSATENPLSFIFKSHGLLNSGSIKISKPFLTQLQQTNDPRMVVYAALPDGNTAANLQKGLPNGYDIMTIPQGEPGYTSLADYSTFNPETILQLDAPTVFMTHAEVELLQAEAILKGWISGNAGQHYEAAVRSSMKQQAIYGEKGVISESKIDDYLSHSLYDQAKTPEERLNVIGTEFWIATFINGYESYANWRRTGYPKLTPVSYSGSHYKGSIPRRFSYPMQEYSINKSHVEDAVTRQGADNLSTRIWWDKN